MGDHARKGRKEKVPVSLSFRKEVLFTICNAAADIYFAKITQKAPAESHTCISAPAKCRQLSCEQHRSCGSPPGHSQPAPNLSERWWAQASAGTTNCFMLCCHPVGLQDRQHNPCLHCASLALIHFVAFVQSFPQHTHTAMLPVYQVTSDFPGDEIKVFDSLNLVLDYPWSWELKRSLRT